MLQKGNAGLRLLASHWQKCPSPQSHRPEHCPVTNWDCFFVFFLRLSLLHCRSVSEVLNHNTDGLLHTLYCMSCNTCMTEWCVHTSVQQNNITNLIKSGDHVENRVRKEQSTSRRSQTLHFLWPSPLQVQPTTSDNQLHSSTPGMEVTRERMEKKKEL